MIDQRGLPGRAVARRAWVADAAPVAVRTGPSVRRLHQVLDRFPYGDQVRVVHRSFQLHPDLPREGVSQRELIRMVGAPATTVDRVLRPIERAAEAEGLTPYNAVDRTLGPTDLAHELLAYATEQGRGTEIWTAMFRAHFGQARKLWTAEEVLDFAAEAGLDRADAAEALRSRRYRAKVATDQREAERLGARGAPFLVFGGRFAVPGAIGLDDLRSVHASVRSSRKSRAGAADLGALAGAAGGRRRASGLCGGSPAVTANNGRMTGCAVTGLEIAIRAEIVVSPVGGGMWVASGSAPGRPGLRGGGARVRRDGPGRPVEAGNRTQRFPASNGLDADQDRGATTQLDFPDSSAPLMAVTQNS
ncbi:DsbA family protein [Micromonospora zamorensis]|uniref:DsbA family protein n=1 Tax=Micromonospora zamorensis TaxID=709883 RepID=UPI0037A9D3BF